MAHDEHHGSRFIQHHFDDAKHQFDCGKLGIWAFLAQEVLFFSALFVAYIILRYNHPEVFAYAHRYLDTKWGAINTGVLIASSLSAAWAVRAAQKNQQKLLVACLSFTVLCACGFLGIKYVEYSHKFHINVEPGCRFGPTETPDGRKIEWPEATQDRAIAEGGFAMSSKVNCRALNRAGARVVGATAPAGLDEKTMPAGVDTNPAQSAVSPDTKANRVDPQTAPNIEMITGQQGDTEEHDTSDLPPPGTNMFFTIYFAMTGLHGIHVLVGVFVFIWLTIRAAKGHFNDQYYGPIDFAALYWHLVDLIWIYLFPLLYLIH